MRTTMHLPCRISSCVRRIPDRRRRWTALVLDCYSCRIEPPIVLARQSDGAVVDLLAVHFMRLQFFARTEVMKAPTNNKEIFSIFFYCFYWLFFYYTYRSQKYFLLSFPVICDLTRRDRFFIHAKCLMLSLRECCRYRRLTCFSFLSLVSRRGKTCLFSML